ncbi:MAG TPA: hypothetical protein VKT78_05920 [Fimbriimonadaceae bacterium]|nr:hypothetical protein [Fimbriimonadaceae bacterium]
MCSFAFQVSNMFAKIVPNPTGNNGYEEYVRAAEIASDAEFPAYQRRLLETRSSDPELEPQLPSDVDPRDLDLAIRRKWTSRYRICCNLISVGNRKPVYDPRESIAPETTFPEMAKFKSLAALEAATAHVAFADGNSGDAVGHIEEGLMFGEKLGGAILISRLVGVACSTTLLSELDDHWPQLSLNDAHELRGFFGKRLATPPLMIEALKGERRATKSAIEEMFSKPDQVAKEWSYDGGDSFGKDMKTLAALNPIEAANLRADTEGVAYQQVDAVIGLFNGPETEWLKYKDPTDAEKNRSLASRLADVALPSLSNLIVAEARSRTRLRLAYLTASAIEFRWINGRLPNAIEEFTTPDERRDPTSGRSFSYRRDGPWFHITRENRDALGGVGVKPAPNKPDPDSIPVRA